MTKETYLKLPFQTRRARVTVQIDGFENDHLEFKHDFINSINPLDITAHDAEIEIIGIQGVVKHAITKGGKFDSVLVTMRTLAHLAYKRDEWFNDTQIQVMGWAEESKSC